MLKKVTFFLTMLLLPFGVMAQSKFAHFNAQDVITEMKEYKSAMATLADMQQRYQEELNRTKDDFNKKYQEYLTQADALPRNIAERRQKELQDMAQRQEQFQKDAYEAMQKARQEALDPILQKVNEAVKKVGDAEGYVYIFDLASTPISYIGAESEDITAKIKAQLGLK